MDSSVKEFEHLRISLDEIKRVTNNFSNKHIGWGGFGKVYKGELSHSKGRSLVAIKRLDRKFGQGDREFWTEIKMLSRYSHENLISLLGFCDEAGEKLLVYELASNGSLERHLNSPDLGWQQRIKICLDTAKGLCYLHDDNGIHQRVIHRDVKSSNILLDDQWKAKVSDMGLSKLGPANQEHTALFTYVAGTPGYVDPAYRQTYVLTKESDVYSFGVVLLEVLCGKLCLDKDSKSFLLPTWKKRYKNKMTHQIIFQGLTPPMEITSLEAFSDIAFQCLEDSVEKRPTMSHVVEQLEMALLFEQYRDLKLPKEYVIILNKVVATPLIYISVEELKLRLSHGVFLDAGKTTWFSINDKGEHSVLISIDECLIREEGKDYEFSTAYNSRFPVGTYSTLDCKFKTRVITQILSPNITYALNLIYKNWFSSGPFHSEDAIEIEYKLDGETKTWTTYLGDHRGNGWYAVELYQFTSDGTPDNLDIIFEAKLYSGRVVEGIEFQSIENVEEGQVSDDDIQPPPVSDSNDDTYWELKLPNDYQDIIKLLKDRVKRKTKELYSIFCQRFLTIDGSFFKRLFNNRKWSFLDKNGKKCLMISARAAFRVRKIKKTSWVQSEHSRFGKVLMIKVITGFPVAVTQNKIKYVGLSLRTKYACYLVYKLPEDRSNLQMPVEVRVLITDDKQYVFLVSPQIPVIRQKQVDEITHNPLFKPKIKGLPKQRSDAWMEVQVYEFHTTDTMDGFIPVLRLAWYSGDLEGLIIQGVEIRPI